MKLTLVSIVFHGLRISRFVMAKIDERGKAIISPKIIAEMTKGIPNGATFTFGA